MTSYLLAPPFLELKLTPVLVLLFCFWGENIPFVLICLVDRLPNPFSKHYEVLVSFLIPIFALHCDAPTGGWPWPQLLTPADFGLAAVAEEGGVDGGRDPLHNAVAVLRPGPRVDGFRDTPATAGFRAGY